MLNILVPTDFSAQSRYAAEFACQLSQLTEVRITLLHVLEIPPMLAPDPSGLGVPLAYDEEFVKNTILQGEKKLQEFATAYAQCAVKQKVTVGHTYRAITDEVKEENLNLIVMGTKGASGLHEFFIGSNAQKIVRRAPCPVITLAERTDVSAIKSIVYATELSETSKYLLRKLRKLQELFGAQLHLVRINTRDDFESDDVCLEFMQNLSTHYALKNYTVNTYNHEEEVAGILAFAKSKQADLVAIGTHGRTGLKQLLSGSLAEDLVNCTKLPVWSCHLEPQRTS